MTSWSGCGKGGVIRARFAKTSIPDNTATTIFTISTTDESGDNDLGNYACKVHALVTNHPGSSRSYQAAKSFLAHFAHVNNKNGSPATSAVTEVSETAQANTGGYRQIGTVTMTAVENGKYEVQVKFTIDCTGSAGSRDAGVVCLVELAWEGYLTAPTLSVA